MATIKAIEGRSVHQIQSGQVIVDLCSVVKELVENSVDAGATSIDVRFKNHGLESIEVQDNGSGISPENYKTLALKHYTSKLSSYADLTSLQTFGFRGEALSSLCALSDFHVLTARTEEAPKGTRLDFETSGALKGTKVVACQQGTTVAVENLFKNLPVRRRELEKNIKREYGKVLGVLQAYACISTGVKFGVSHQVPNGKKAVVCATKSNPSTRENIANVFGAKTLTGLIALDLRLELRPSGTDQRWNTQEDGGMKEVRIVGHISKPVFGEGRQTPDRQMFFVNARPCGLPQIGKAFNEVYKSYNVSQSPFVLANLVMDTNAYDVNVSPDKRTILLHDQNAMIDALKTSVTELFDKQEHTVPQSQFLGQKPPPFRQLTINLESIANEASLASPLVDSAGGKVDSTSKSDGEAEVLDHDNGTMLNQSVGRSTSLIQKFVGRNAEDRVNQSNGESKSEGISKEKQKIMRKLSKGNEFADRTDHGDDISEGCESSASTQKIVKPIIPVLDFNRRIAEQEALRGLLTDSSLEGTGQQDEILNAQPVHSRSKSGTALDPSNRIPSKREPPEVATITIGSKTIVTHIGTPLGKRRRADNQSNGSTNRGRSSRFGSSLKAFVASGTQVDDSGENNMDEEDEPGPDPAVTPSEDESRTSSLEDAATVDGEALNHQSEDDMMDEGRVPKASLAAQEEESDQDYIDEEDNKAQEEAKVAQLIQRAEKEAARPSQNNEERARRLLRGRSRKDSTVHLVQVVGITVPEINKQLKSLAEVVDKDRDTEKDEDAVTENDLTQQETAEERLSLTVAKSDFARMRIIGQFNLGFILVTRPAKPPSDPSCMTAENKDEVFIIDQHASDEKYNFERLQSETTVQSQPLVRSHPLDLTAMEEEVILGNLDGLEKNGFQVDVDDSGTSQIGKRCKLISLPMSREVVFTTRDLEELLALLAESPPLTSSTSTSSIPRPSKVRRMFAMRACRSSVMVGKTLTRKQMGRIVGHMGMIDKPWNCPHGRPTMRHLIGLTAWDGWREGDGVVGLEGRAMGGDGEGRNRILANYVDGLKGC